MKLQVVCKIEDKEVSFFFLRLHVGLSTTWP